MKLKFKALKFDGDQYFSPIVDEYNQNWFLSSWFEAHSAVRINADKNRNGEDRDPRYKDSLILPFIGLKDSQETDLYLGDIVYIAGLGTHKIVFDSGCFGIIDPNTEMFTAFLEYARTGDFLISETGIMQSVELRKE